MYISTQEEEEEEEEEEEGAKEEEKKQPRHRYELCESGRGDVGTRDAFPTARAHQYRSCAAVVKAKGEREKDKKTQIRPLRLFFFPHCPARIYIQVELVI